MRRALIAISLVLAFAATATAGTPRESLDKARDAFRKKDCDSAVPHLKNVLYPVEQIADADSLFEARVMLGACLADTGARDDAKVEFEKALVLKPRAVLDPMFYSERSVRLFDDTKADIANRATKDAELRALQKAREDLEERIKNTRSYQSNPYALNFAPFGVGQLQNGQKLKAALFAGGQVATLGTSVGIWYYLVNKYGIRSDKVPLEEGPRVRRLQQIEIGTGIAFFGLYAWSVIDALRYWQPKKQIENDEELLRELRKEIEKQKPPPKQSFFDKLKLSPMVTTESVGIGIGWEN
jgi:tetratricopeptide (TPR) repeat protein